MRAFSSHIRHFTSMRYRFRCSSFDGLPFFSTSGSITARLVFDAMRTPMSWCSLAFHKNYNTKFRGGSTRGTHSSEPFKIYSYSKAIDGTRERGQARRPRYVRSPDKSVPEANFSINSWSAGKKLSSGSDDDSRHKISSKTKFRTLFGSSSA